MKQRAPVIMAAVVVGAFLSAPSASAQLNEFELGKGGDWVQTAAPEPGTDEALIAEARRLLAEGKPGAANSLLSPWIKKNRRRNNPWLAEAYLLRGDARTASGREFKALYDYEEVANGFPGTEEFVLALEREFEIGLRYLGGLRKRFLGFRIDDATPLGEELLVRVAERLPKSQLAERVIIELADYYYRVQNMGQAAEAYDIFLTEFPKSEFRQKAMQRRIYANIARFKGPKYDAGGLTEASVLIRQFADLYPAEAEQAGMSDALVARIDESAGAQMLDTAQWYLKRGDPVSARLTLRRLARKHPQTVAASEAFQIMSERAWLEDTMPTPPEIPLELPESEVAPEIEGDENEPTSPEGGK